MPPLTLAQIAAALVVALAIDRWWGEPRARWHPVVWMGRFLGWAGGWAAPKAAIGADSTLAIAASDPGQAELMHFTRGAAAWCLGATLVFVLASGIQAMCLRMPFEWLLAVALGFVLKPMLAWGMLKDEVLSVERALQQSLEQGQMRLSGLVSRDVGALSESAVRESAIESLAENLNDSVVAPIFWFVLLGLPGAAVYRFANTADAMWGYRGVRNGQVWEWGGKWAARADDLLSWVPARITAALLMVVGPCGSAKRWQALNAEAARTPSPNSGWPMAAMALVLGVRLSKPGTYVLNAGSREPQGGDVDRAIEVASRAVFWVGAVALAAAWGVSLMDFYPSWRFE